MRKFNWIYPLVLAAAVFLSFWPALRGGFVYDDHFQLERNPYIRDLRFIKVLFTEDVWGFSGTTQSTNYRPLHMLTYLVVYQFFGLNPFAFHLVNLLLYLGCVLLLWQILQHSVEGLPAFVASLLFATHPVHVEPVAWIGGTPELLCGLFLLSSFWNYLRGSLWISLLLFAAALFSKEPALLFPGIVLIDHWMFHRTERRKFQIWILCAAVILFIYLAARAHAIGGSWLMSRQISASVAEQLLAGLAFAGFYISKLLVPSDLNAFYDYHVPLSLFEQNEGLFVLLAGLTVVFLLRKNRRFLLGAGWFVMLLLPALVIKAVSVCLFAERYVYLPSAGLFLGLAALPIKRVSAVFLIFLSLVFGGMSYSRSQVWHDDVTLWKDTIHKSPESVIVNYNLATAYFERNNWRQASLLYLRTIALQPGLAEAYYSLAVCYHNLGDDAKAARNLQLFLKHWKRNDAIRQDAISKLKQLSHSL